MRKTMFALTTALTALAGSIAAPSSAFAYEYPYCLQGRTVGVPGECSYQTYAQCMASASGRGLYCNINPRAAYAQQPRQRIIRRY